MFSLAYVILPFTGTPPAEAIAASLARFQRGRRGDVPDQWLTFHDQTAEVHSIHEATLTLIKGQGLQTKGHDSWYLNSRAIVAEMEKRGKQEWSVRFADLEPDLAHFAERFLLPFDRHPVTGGFGFWLNSLGRWDWWELGGRFNGVITAQPRPRLRPRTDISSGPSRGRDVLQGIENAVGDTLGNEPIEEADIYTDENVELVAQLLHDVNEHRVEQLPGALILPPTVATDELRWIANWPSLGPADALALLGLPPTTSWHEVVRTTYERFQDHWAAGVAFHH